MVWGMHCDAIRSDISLIMGYELLARIRPNTYLCHLPIIATSAQFNRGTTANGRIEQFPRLDLCSRSFSAISENLVIVGLSTFIGGLGMAFWKTSR